jgi:hypothetical protein
MLGTLRWIVVVSVTAAAAVAAPPCASSTRAQPETVGGRSTYNAMWLSIAHPGLGEYYLKGWGSFEKCPQRKFWLGLIPLYGWPGYLQVKSAIDARNGRTNDDLTFPD